MLRSSVVALLLLAGSAWGGCGPSDTKVEAYTAEVAKLKRAMAELKEKVDAKLAKLNDAIEAEKQEWAKAEAAHQQRMKAIVEARDTVAAEGKAAASDLRKHLARLEYELAALHRKKAIDEKHRSAEGKAKTSSVEDKLDLILKKLDDLDKRVRQLEGKPQGILYDGRRPRR